MIQLMRHADDQAISGTILIADDNAANRELFEEILVAHGYTVVTASDGAEALLRLSDTHIDLVLCDVTMPGKNGFDVCREIKSGRDRFLTPVVLITALSDKQSRLEGIRAGADDFLTRPVDRTELLARVRSLLLLKLRTDDLESAETVLFTLARSIEGKDPYTSGHCERISLFSARLGERMGLSAELVTALRRAGVVHDIGKVTVPDAILLKKGPLTPEEFLVMKEHTVTGERICAPLRSLRLVLPIIRHHHEKANGSGYPDRLLRDQTPVTARILQVVDVYDALTTLRPYKSALSSAAAIAIMKREVEKGWWDPEIVDAYQQLLKDGGDEPESLVGHRRAIDLVGQR